MTGNMTVPKTSIAWVRAAAALAAAPLLFLAGQALAQASTAPIDTPSQARSVLGPEALVRQDQRGQRPPPLGSELFLSAPPQGDNAIVDAGYILKPGDRVRVTLYGLVDNDQELTIDSQGNVLVPGVGPVRLAGVTAGQAPSVIEQASRRVYSQGVQVYAAPVAAASIQVLVTGPVERPGAYAGASDDAIVTYLQRAGGIDPDRGSYRRVRVVRQGQTLAEADIYDFLREGLSPQFSFRNGDAIVVGDQGSIVSVSGEARAPYTFELDQPTGVGGEIMSVARPRPDVSHVAIVGVRQGQPYSAYVPLAEFVNFPLYDGDRLQFERDVRAAEILVRIEGTAGGPSVFSVPRGSTVASVLAQAPISADADMANIHLRRESVRQTQKQLLDDGLTRLERAMFTAPSRGPSEAAARAQSLSFVSEWIERARRVEPLGVLALGDQDLNAVRLETGDVIVVPGSSQVVTIAGEVNAPQTTIFTGRSAVGDYVRLAGGYTPRADRRNVMVFRPDGRVRADRRVQPGDRILVVGKPDSTLLPFIRDLTQTLFQTAGIFLAIDRAGN